MGDITPGGAAVSLAAEVSSMDGGAAGGGEDAAAGGVDNPKKRKAPPTKSTTKAALKKLMEASALGAVRDLKVSLSFTLEGLDYACALNVGKTRAGAEMFPELHALLDAYPRKETFMELLERVVRCCPACAHACCRARRVRASRFWALARCTSPPRFDVH
jgi:hypothetical protein